MATPVSWMVVERGWRVVGTDGAELGKVDDITGDPEADIFDGIVVSRGLLKSRRYIPSEHVGEITDDELVRVQLDRAAFEALGEKPPPGAPARVP
jgi:uncharacterized protein YrrD